MQKDYYIKRMAVLKTREEVIDYFYAVLNTPHLVNTRVTLGSDGLPEEEFYKDSRVRRADFQTAFSPYLDGEHSIIAAASISDGKGRFSLNVTDGDALLEIVLTTTDPEVEKAAPLIQGLIDAKYGDIRTQ